ncbi:MAG: hypothetical protein JXB32_15015 [Deltaproteobacteria bacterium]|nr:hypothetical protein [Deltaproteobacteria bacterium]
MKRSILLAIPLFLVSAAPRSAEALQTITPGTDGIERISGGVMELGLDAILLVRSRSSSQGDTETSVLDATFVGGLTPRYFLIDNLSLALNVNVFYGRAAVGTSTAGADVEEVTSDLGFLGVVLCNYYLRLGYGMFWKPGLGAGGFYGTRSTPSSTAGLKLESSIYGGVVQLDLGFVYYAGPHFNLKAGPQILVRFGQEKFEGAPEANSLLTVEAAFNAGLAYSF